MSKSNNPLSSIFYTYVYLDPRKSGDYIYQRGIEEVYCFNHELIYTGKGSNDRINDHIKDALNSDTNKLFYNVIRKIYEAGLEPIRIKILQNVTEEEAFAEEITLISIAGRRDLGKGPLCNETDGGEGKSNNIEDLSGQKFGNLIVLKYMNTDKYSKSRWLCECKCGNKKIIGRMGLVTERTKSCGCLRKKVVKEVMSKHNMSDTSTHKAWLAMIRQYEAHKNSCIIKMYERWFDFSNFYEDMGERPENTSIMRIDRNDNFSPHNCKWASKEEIRVNKPYGVFLIIDGIQKTLSMWSEITGIKYDTIRGRIRKGWTPKEAVFGKH